MIQKLNRQTILHQMLSGSSNQHIYLDKNTGDWFDIYLTGRMQQVKINGISSDYLPVIYGVPQGSI